LTGVDGDPHYTLGNHDRRYVVNPECAAAASCRLAVTSYDAATGRKLGNIVYRWNGDAFTYSGDAGYFRSDGGADCEIGPGDVMHNAYRTRELARFVPQNMTDTTRLTGSKTITGTPTADAAAAGCQPFELRYDAVMSFTN
jgi:hypothetical protein